jgi:uncharacterized protein with NRDE domain
MCLILFAAQAHPRYPLIVAANRDESYARPTAAAGFWKDDPRVCAGRDLEQGGTWLGIARNGRFAAITNYRQGVRRADGARSRGELTRNFLTGDETPGAYVRDVETRAADYNGFSLIVGEPGAMWFYSNRGGAAQTIAPGVHGLSNHLLDEPWPKVLRGTAELRALLAADEAELVGRLFEVLADRAPAPEDSLPSTGVGHVRERALSASFIDGETYGTRASTVLLVGADGNVLVRERSFGPRGTALGETEHHFELDRNLNRAPPAPARA